MSSFHVQFFLDIVLKHVQVQVCMDSELSFLDYHGNYLKGLNEETYLKMQGLRLKFHPLIIHRHQVLDKLLGSSENFVSYSSVNFYLASSSVELER